MNKSAYFFSGVCFCFLVVGAIYRVFAQPMEQHEQVRLPDGMAQQYQRTPFPAIGGWTILNCSDSAAATVRLNAWSRYVIQCGVNTRIATGDKLTDEADANDG
jgi:hypothetical protein